jgi:hypothetical protein
VDDETQGDAADAVVPHPTWRFARYLVAYRGSLSRQEASRRAGLPEVLWARIENTPPSGATSQLVPPAIVASMCSAVHADIATGLTLAGHQSDAYQHLIERPPVFSAFAHRTQAVAGPYIATPHVIRAALGGDSVSASEHIAAVYREIAESNRQVADLIGENPPDARSEYWSGYAAAIRAVAEQQSLAAGPGAGA